MESSISSNIVTIATALTGVIGAISGLTSVLITYLNYSKDSAKVKVRALKGMKTFIPDKKRANKVT